MTQPFAYPSPLPGVTGVDFAHVDALRTAFNTVGSTAYDYYRMGALARQPEYSACGLTSLWSMFTSMGLPVPSVGELKALAIAEGIIDARRFEETGLTLGQLGKLAEVVLARAGDTTTQVSVLDHLSHEEFAAEMERVNDRDHYRYTINFFREVAIGAGGGHFSPLVATLAGRSLIADTNTFYPPYFVPIENLHAASIETRDSTTGEPRGLLRIYSPTAIPPSPLDPH